MSAQRVFIPAGAGIAALGGYLYYNSSRPEKSREDQRRERSQAKKDAGLGGAGVGQNAVTGLHEKGGPGSGVPTANTDPDRAVKTDARKEDLPSGGVGGGVGAGGANTRKTVDITTKSAPGEGSGPFGSGTGSTPQGQSSSSNKDNTSGRSSGSSLNSATSSSGNTGSSQGKDRSWSQGLQGIFGQGGSSASQNSEQETKIHDTKVHSHHAETPTKRFTG